MTVVAVVAAIFIPTTPRAPGGDHHEHHLDHAELALVPGGTLTEVMTADPGRRHRQLA